jgi:hypothetical protein
MRAKQRELVISDDYESLRDYIVNLGSGDLAGDKDSR